MTRRVARQCQACGADQPREYAPDPCLGTLPDCSNACCGHGNRQLCYLTDQSGGKWRGDTARLMMIASGGRPAAFTTDQAQHGLMPGWVAK